jgi:hypothetical protein
MDDYARATGQPKTVTIRDVDYRVHKFRPRDLGEIEAWMKTRVANPREEARRYMEGLPDAVAKHVWDRALEASSDWPPTFENDAGQALLMSEEGMAFIVWVCLRRGIAGFTLDQARDLAETLDVDDVLALTEAAKPGEVGDPKVPAAEKAA